MPKTCNGKIIFTSIVGWIVPFFCKTIIWNYVNFIMKLLNLIHHSIFNRSLFVWTRIGSFWKWRVTLFCIVLLHPIACMAIFTIETIFTETCLTFHLGNLIGNVPLFYMLLCVDVSSVFWHEFHKNFSFNMCMCFALYRMCFILWMMAHQL